MLEKYVANGAIHDLVRGKLEANKFNVVVDILSVWKAYLQDGILEEG